jgi:DNA repair protein RecO (recombination protein O)
VALVRFELLLLAELGFGLDLGACAVTGSNDRLAYVSPATGRAVSQAAAVGYEPRLLRLPRFLTGGGAAQWPDILDGLAVTGHFIARHLFVDRRSDVLAARERLVERLKRAIA